jgi:hypothetical protein
MNVYAILHLISFLEELELDVKAYPRKTLRLRVLHGSTQWLSEKEWWRQYRLS